MKRSTVYSRCAVVASLLALGLPAARAFRAPEHESLPNFDTRQQAAQTAGTFGLTGPQTRAAAGRLLPAAPGDSVVVRFDPLIGLPRHVSARTGFLSGPGGAGGSVSAGALAGVAANDSHRVVKAFLNDHPALFGRGADLLDTAVVSRDTTGRHNGLRSVTWHQQADGIPVFNGLLTAHITKDGELVSLSSGLVSDPAAAAARVANPVSAQQAVAAATANIGEPVAAAALLVTRPESGATRTQGFTAAGLKGEASARLVWLPMNGSSLKLCWDVWLTSKARGEGYQVLVDAETGTAVLRHCRTQYYQPVSYNVYDSDSPSPFSPGWPSPNSGQPSVVSRTNITIAALSTNDSPNGWIDDAGTNTLGNNVDSHLDRNDDDTADPGSRPVSTNRVYDFALNLASAPSTYTNASVVQLFFLNNWVHDLYYELGFTEANGNFQQNNFGRGGAGGDRLLADCQDGGGFNNANMSTWYDGTPPRMQMYLFDGPSPDRDGSLDAEIVIHEHTHGLSNRRVGNGSLINELQTAGMGEGWSDFYALALLSSPTDTVDGCYATGGYATYQMDGLTQNYYFGIRRYPYSTRMTNNPLTFKDIDPDQASLHPGVPLSPLYSWFDPFYADEVHFQGEVWCSALWEVRANLIAKHGAATGNQLMLQLVTDGMGLSPADPNFLEARDAIIQADIINNGGVNRAQIWAGFAKRGMGYSASSPASYTTAGVVEAFDLPAGVDVVGLGSQVSAESCSPGNGFIDPDETVTVLFTLQNQGLFDNASNVVATLLTNAGVANVSGPQIYGLLLANGGNAVTQSFTFTTHGSCGGIISNVLHVMDGTNDLGLVVFNSLLGTPSTNIGITVTQGFDSVVAPALPSGWTTIFSGLQPPWKSSAYQPDSPPNCAFSPDNSGVGENSLISPAFIVLSAGANLTFTHHYVLHAPTTGITGYDGGVLEIKMGGGDWQDIVAAGGVFSQGGYDRVISSRNGNPLGGRDAWSGNSGGYVTTIVGLPPAAAGQICQLRWRLGTDSFTGAAGWRVDNILLTDILFNCCGGSDIAIGLDSAPHTAVAGQTLTFALFVTNLGPSAASGVVVTNVLPPAITFNSAVCTPGTAQYSNGLVVCDLGTMASGAVATASIVVVPSNQLPQIFTLTNFATVSISSTEAFNGNNVGASVVVVYKDSVGDGVPDWWRSQHFGGVGDTTNGTNCAACDPDGDGRTNLQEFQADTEPTNSASLLKIVAVSNAPPAIMTFFPSSTGRTYALEYSGDLATGVWITVDGQSWIYGSGGVTNLPDTNNPAANFYRIKATLP